MSSSVDIDTKMAEPQVNEEKQTNRNCHGVENDVNHLTNFSNFSIDEILKPDFGVKKFAEKVRSTCDDGKERKPPMRIESPPKSRGTPPTPDGVAWPAWVYCTRYSDRPSSGPRSRKMKRKEKPAAEDTSDDKRPRTAFTNDQLQKLKIEFDGCRYLTEQRRRDLASTLCLTEAQVKIWFQNKRAKLKKTSGVKTPLALHLMAQGLYNHVTNGLPNDTPLDMTS